MIYKFVKLLGEGSYGKAFLCTSKEDNSYCVIKQINMTNMNEKEKNETVNEAKILKKLDHPNIIKFKDVFQSKKPISLNIVTEYADGGDLSIKIKSHQKNKSYFPENEILDIFTQICSAIKHIHHKKILHRDLKSQNVFMTNSKRNDVCCTINLEKNKCSSSNYITVTYQNDVSYEAGKFPINRNNIAFLNIGKKSLGPKNALSLPAETEIEIHFSSPLSTLKQFFDASSDSNCEQLKSVQFTNFNSQSLTDMSKIFYGCTNIKSIDLILVHP